MIKDFIREMQMLSMLRHPNLLLFLGVSFDTRTNLPKWIVTELMSKSLYNVVHDDKVVLTLTQIVNIGIHIARGLQYLHQQSDPIIHRYLYMSPSLHIYVYIIYICIYKCMYS